MLNIGPDEKLPSSAIIRKKPPSTVVMLLEADFGQFKFTYIFQNDIKISFNKILQERPSPI